MPDNLKELLRKVYNVDTLAGDRLRYHIMRALACEDYSDRISFAHVAGDLSGLFTWSWSSEAGPYWANIALMMGE